LRRTAPTATVWLRRCRPPRRRRLAQAFPVCHPCKNGHLPLDCHCNLGVNRQLRRGNNGKRLLTSDLDVSVIQRYLIASHHNAISVGSDKGRGEILRDDRSESHCAVQGCTVRTQSEASHARTIAERVAWRALSCLMCSSCAARRSSLSEICIAQTADSGQRTADSVCCSVCYMYVCCSMVLLVTGQVMHGKRGSCPCNRSETRTILVRRSSWACEGGRSPRAIKQHKATLREINLHSTD